MWLFGKNQQEVTDLFLDLLGQWWWAALIALAVIAIGIPVAMASVDAISDRRRQSLPRPRPGAPAAAGNPFENALFGGAEPAGPIPAPPALEPHVRAPTPRPVPRPTPPPASSRQDGGMLVSDPDFGLPATEGEGRTVFVPGATVLVAERGGAVATDETLYTVAGGLVDLAVLGGHHVLLAADGRVLDWADGKPEVETDVRMEEPLGLAAAADAVVAAGAGGQLAAVQVQAAGIRLLGQHALDGRIASFALNPFGTIAAVALARPPAVQAVVLATGDAQPLDAEDGLTTAMAFSADGRRLALGRSDGTLAVFDMATRRLEGPVLEPPAKGAAIVAVAPSPVGGWVTAHASGHLLRWDAAGARAGESTETGTITSIAIDPASGRIAVGRSDGHVAVHPAALDGPAASHAMADGPIARVLFEDQGGGLLCAARGGAVQRLTV
jgi:hypothetical protein